MPQHLPMKSDLLVMTSFTPDSRLSQCSTLKHTRSRSPKPQLRQQFIAHNAMHSWGQILEKKYSLYFPLQMMHRVNGGVTVAHGGAVSAPSHQELDQERATVRLAAQAAAGALSSVCPCSNIVLCPTTLHHSPTVMPYPHHFSCPLRVPSAP